MGRDRLSERAGDAAALTVVFFALVVVAAMVAYMAVLAGSWLWIVALLVGALFLLACGWSALEVVIARQMDRERAARARGDYALRPIERPADRRRWRR
ncbi:hypothetical protein LO772_16085 [Yinghuangia sp. ASG 101]|uniref:hypothetical protein n=1 Tax=Yinghuangia sp. ASG 101 TaxID=2896848 RepID=UPI001E28A09D|nr:hypothetical protein [Yinghuangia sp. ASG 101]UGQ14949.1 hypothetical protein LO772_16085 [Yinghuangia sp. ASG 101]